MERPGTELKSTCVPLSINTFSGHLPTPHDACTCHNTSAKKRGILREMKKIINHLEQLPKCDQWDTRSTTNDTTGPFRFGVYRQQGKPWDPHRVKSLDLIASELHRGCACIKKNGLQDECQRLQCRGRPWCMKEPFPQCPPFSNIPQATCDPDPFKVCPRRPWEKHPYFKPPCDTSKKDSKEKAVICEIQCPKTGTVETFSVAPISTAELPEHFQRLTGPFFKLQRLINTQMTSPQNIMRQKQSCSPFQNPQEKCSGMRQEQSCPLPQYLQHPDMRQDQNYPSSQYSQPKHSESCPLPQYYRREE